MVLVNQCLLASLQLNLRASKRFVRQKQKKVTKIKQTCTQQKITFPSECNDCKTVILTAKTMTFTLLFLKTQDNNEL